MPSAWSKAAHGAPQSATAEAIARIASHQKQPIEVPGRHFFADLCWPELNLIVEADSWRWHGGRLATERDREHDQLPAIAGRRVVHFTRDQIKRQRAETGRRLVALLRRCAARTGRGS